MPYGLRGAVPDPTAVATHWWCPVPGTPVSSFDVFLGCPANASGMAPTGAQPGEALVNRIVYPPSVYTPPVVSPNPAVDAGSGTLAAPYDCVANPVGDPSCPGYDAALAASSAAQKASNAHAMDQIAANIRAAVQATCPGELLVDNADGSASCPSALTSTFPWGWIAAGAGLLAFGMVAMGGGSARRYGQ